MRRGRGVESRHATDDVVRHPRPVCRRMPPVVATGVAVFCVLMVLVGETISVKSEEWRQQEKEESTDPFDELIGRSAVIQTDESRRIYAISIPRIFQDDRIVPEGGNGGYHPPVYHPQPSGEPGGYDRQRPLHSAVPQHPHYPPAPQPPHWKSGLRLIVSGPIDDSSPKSYQRQHDSISGLEYNTDPENYRSGFQFSDPYRNIHSDDRPQSKQNNAEPWGTYRGEQYYPSYQEEEGVINREEIPHIPQDEGKLVVEDPSSIFINRPYHKLAEPYGVLDESNFRKQDENSESSSVQYAENKPRHIESKDLETPVLAADDELLLSVPHDDYDALFEEFMENAYDDYYEPPAEGKSKNPWAHKSAPALPGVDMVELDISLEETTTEGGHRKSETRRDPPSDVYTHSRLTMKPKTLMKTSLQKSTTETITETRPGLTGSHFGNGSRNEPNENHSAASSTPAFDTPKSPPSSTSVKSVTDDSLAFSISDTITTQPSKVPKPYHPYKHEPSSSLVSLSEILQGVGISLPQFLVQLKMHGSDMKEFTSKLERKALTKHEFTKAQGNVGELLKILDESGVSQQHTSPVTVLHQYTTTKPSFRRLSHGYQGITKGLTSSEESVRNSSSISPVDASLASEKIETTTSSTSIITVTTTSVSITPNVFGFRPLTKVDSNGVVRTVANISTTSSNNTITRAQETDELTSTTPPIKQLRATSDVISSDEHSSVYRPYKPDAGDWRDRMQYNRGVSSRLGTTTRRPTVRPPYAYYGGNTELLDLIDSQDSSERSFSKETVEIDVVEIGDPLGNRANRIGLSNIDSTIVGLTEGGNYDHPRYDRDPNSLNIATRSAIMAAGVLGGIALAVFLTILVFVMYRNHVGRRRLRIPLQFSLPSDDSASSTPPLYSTRSRSGIGTRSSDHTDFWGTLKRKFDPYSLSSSSASYY